MSESLRTERRSGVTLGVQPIDLESLEKEVSFRGTLSFDVIEAFRDGVKTPIIVEMNGTNSGITGVTQLPDGAISEERRKAAQERMKLNPRRDALAQQCDDAALAFARAFERAAPPQELEQLQAVETHLRAALKQLKLFDRAHQNPPFIEEIANNKRMQRPYFPDGHGPRRITSLAEIPKDTTYVIIKPHESQGGAGIILMTPKQLARDIAFRERKGKGRQFFEDYELQILDRSLGSDAANHAHAPRQFSAVRPACMRVFTDFVVYKDGSIRFEYIEAYQRVSRYAPEDIGKRKTIRHEKTGAVVAQIPIVPRDVFVVNIANDADVMPATDEEVARAMPLVKEMIQKVTRAYHDQHSPRSNI